MKILHLTSHFSAGGITSYILTLLRKLKERGIPVYCASSGGELVPELERYDIPHFQTFVNTKNELHPKLFLAVLQIAELIRIHEITHIHAHTRVTQLVADTLHRTMKVKYVSTCHSFYKQHFLRRVFPAWGQRIIAPSDAVREHLVNDFKLPRAIVSVIPNGIDCERYRLQLTDYDKQILREYHQLEGATFVLGSISKLEKSKGYHVLVEAMVSILEAFPRTKLVLVGMGKYKSRLIRLARKLGVERSIVFAGTIEKITFLLEVVDLFVLPSIWAEGFGLSILEAMAMGKPVVASNTGSVYTLVHEGENGYLVKPGDVKGLADAILSLMKDTDLRKRMGFRSREIAHGQFAIDLIVDDFIKLYQEL